MYISIKKQILVSLIILLVSCNAPAGNENSVVFLKTTLGDIRIQLYDGTPVHRDNFIRLVKSGFYEGVSFHRVIKDFMIQAGDPKTRSDLSKQVIDSLASYTIPAEFSKQYFHKKGALAAARQGNDINPQMRSSGTQFYIVQGIRYTDAELDIIEKTVNSSMKQAVFNKLVKETADSASLRGINLTNGELQEKASIKMFNYLTSNEDFKIPEEHRNVYESTGGVPRLDESYTVFGEVIEGLDVVDKIASVQTDINDKPLNDIKILKIRIEKK